MKRPAGLAKAGRARPSSPAPVYAEDFSELVPRRSVRRLRLVRGTIKVMN